MLIGAQKSGTTSLAQQLGAQPQICLSAEKEPAFFNAGDDWRSGLDAYHGLFTPAPGQLCLEASTMYTFLPEFGGTHDRIHEYNPDVKLLYVMRDPVERMLELRLRRVRRLTSVPPEGRAPHRSNLREPQPLRHAAQPVLRLVPGGADPPDGLRGARRRHAWVAEGRPGSSASRPTPSGPSTRRQARIDRVNPASANGAGASSAIRWPAGPSPVPAPVRRLAGKTFRTTLDQKPSVSPDMRATVAPRGGRHRPGGALARPSRAGLGPSVLSALARSGAPAPVPLPIDRFLVDREAPGRDGAGRARLATAPCRRSRPPARPASSRKGRSRSASAAASPIGTVRAGSSPSTCGRRPGLQMTGRPQAAASTAVIEKLS